MSNYENSLNEVDEAIEFFRNKFKGDPYYQIFEDCLKHVRSYGLEWDL